jgi:hypothetical protein
MLSGGHRSKLPNNGSNAASLCARARQRSSFVRDNWPPERSPPEADLIGQVVTISVALRLPLPAALAARPKARLRKPIAHVGGQKNKKAF